MRALRGRFTDWYGFIEKFANKKTTDDCYTPTNIYEAIVDYVFAQAGLSPDTEVIRPFYPGGNYEVEEYPEGAVVIDNPPFSILSKILRFYVARDIKFFLFAPTLTLFSSSSSSYCSKIVCHGSITYANKAKIPTSFLTNVYGDRAIIVDAELSRIIRDIDAINARSPREVRKLIYPDNIVSSAILQRLARHVSFTLPASDIAPIKSAGGVAIFGGGYILSERAAAERAAAERVVLLPEEQEIVEALSNGTYGKSPAPFTQLTLF